MSILIKNGKMPISCWDCFLRKDCNEIIIWSKRRPSKCPLIEVPTPHGRLIDADALVKSMRDFSYMWGERMNDEWIGEAPTIIESESGDP